MQRATSRSKRRSRFAGLLLVPVFALVVGACGSSAKSSTTGAGGASPKATANTITIKNFMFTVPASVKAGAKVTVANDDTTTHTVTADDGSFDTGGIAPGKTATITVSKAGTVKFHCNIHNYMQGTLTVTN